VQPLGAGCLDERRHPERLERAPHDARGFEHAIERRADAWIEVEVQVVGSVDIVAPRVPLVQVDASEVDHPQERRPVLDHREIDDVAGAVRDRAGLDQDGRGVGARFMKKKGPEAPFGYRFITRTAADVRQQDVGHRGVVLEEIALREAELGQKILWRLWADLIVADLQDDGVLIARDGERAFRHG
jgi:hypothetical protein